MLILEVWIHLLHRLASVKACLQGGGEADGNAPSSSAAELPDSAQDFGAQMRAAAEARRRDLGGVPKEVRLP